MPIVRMKKLGAPHPHATCVHMLGRGVSGVVSLSELTVDILNTVQCAHRLCSAKENPVVQAVSEWKGAIA